MMKKVWVIWMSYLFFLGFTFQRGRLQIHAKSLKVFKEKVRVLTNRNCGFAMKKQIHKLNLFLRGWGNYYLIANACGITSKGPCRSSKTKGINIAISNEFLERQGLISLRQLWIKIHKEDEPPCAEPHAGWCGGWRLDTSGYPINWHQTK